MNRFNEIHMNSYERITMEEQIVPSYRKIQNTNNKSIAYFLPSPQPS